MAAAKHGRAVEVTGTLHDQAGEERICAMLATGLQAKFVYLLDDRWRRTAARSGAGKGRLASGDSEGRRETAIAGGQ